jgi:hypothetical protein
LVSTQRPPRAITSHVWAEEAQKNTVYLIPFAAKDFINSFLEVLKGGSAAWWPCLAVIAQPFEIHPYLKRLGYWHWYLLLAN